jgi:DNA-binding response OmpR family regulator
MGLLSRALRAVGGRGARKASPTFAGSQMYGGALPRLTPKEEALLQILRQDAERGLSRSNMDISAEMHPPDQYVPSDIVNVFRAKLRAKGYDV